MIIEIPAFTLPESPAQARSIQQELRKRLLVENRFGTLETIGGVDVGYDNARGLAHASVVTMRLGELVPIEQIQVYTPVQFPYVPGLLSFREIPAIIEALKQLAHMPDLLMVDGHGIAHPRRMGIAAHLGAFLEWPTIGVAKKRLTGTYEMPADERGAHTRLLVGDEQIGYVLRTREGVKPVFVSPGHRVGMNMALRIVLQCLTRYKLPEPTRLADKFSKCRIRGR